MKALKALFIRINLSSLTKFLYCNNINYQEWINDSNGEQEIRVDINELSDDKLIKLFDYIGFKYKNNMSNIIDEYNYLIFWH